MTYFYTFFTLNLKDSKNSYLKKKEKEVIKISIRFEEYLMKTTCVLISMKVFSKDKLVHAIKLYML